MKISGLTIIRNAISNGYLIAEVIDNLRMISDEVIVCDGFSTDGTAEYLQKRAQSGDIILYQDEWRIGSQNGLEFASITAKGLERCSGDYIFYLQSDEIVHENDVATLKRLVELGTYNSIVCSFSHIRYDFNHRLNGGYDSAIRIIKNTREIFSKYDGYCFDGAIHPQIHSGVTVHHFGYVFLRNILNKMINHADLFYAGADNYLRRKNLAIEYLARLDRGEIIDPLEIQKTLEPEYSLIPHTSPIPQCMERLRNATQYSLP